MLISNAFALEYTSVKKQRFNANIDIIITFDMQRLFRENINYLSFGKITTTQKLFYQSDKSFSGFTNIYISNFRSEFNRNFNPRV